MKPLEVVIKGSEHVIGYACSNCHLYYSPYIYLAKADDAVAAAKDAAERCCICYLCQQPIVQDKSCHRSVHEECVRIVERDRDYKEWADASPINLADYTGEYVYFDSKDHYCPTD